MVRTTGSRHGRRLDFNDRATLIAMLVESVVDGSMGLTPIKSYGT
jgi:hypothetical protein